VFSGPSFLPPTSLQSDRGNRTAREQIGYFLLASFLENQGVGGEEVIGLCWYCGDKLRDGYDYDVVCRECLGAEDQTVHDEETILDEAIENLTEATQRLRAIRNLLWANGGEDRVSYRDFAHRVSSALAMSEAAYLEARRRSKRG
jgi:hypothetical protein